MVKRVEIRGVVIMVVEIRGVVVMGVGMVGKRVEKTVVMKGVEGTVGVEKVVATIPFGLLQRYQRYCFRI